MKARSMVIKEQENGELKVKESVGKVSTVERKK
jgi:hypothetical protein